jgi:hypothetical protein
LQTGFRLQKGSGVHSIETGGDVRFMGQQNW